uniref:Death domain-containing protein n=1 Tax=Amphimedon queenslandica TaxID=400682 RepID=A0A1X7TDS3_AMPQE
MAVRVRAPVLTSGRTLSIRDLNEVTVLLERHKYDKTSYYQLGLRLLLYDNTLRSIEHEHRGQVDRCFTECLAKWLRKADGVETPTIDTLIAALRGIGENAVADGINGERQNLPAMSRYEATPQILSTAERHPAQPLLVNPGVRNLERRVDQVPNLRDIANELQNNNHDFIGYLNYKLLKKLIELVKDDNEISRRFFEYEKEYAKLLSAASFEDLIPFFEQQSDLSPTAPLGLPYICFRLGSPWLHSRFYTWVSTFGEFSWSYYAILKQLRKNCVIITYAILPFVLDDVIRDLKDPVILKKLEDKGITVIELPQEEEEDFEDIEEDPQIESTAKAEPVRQYDN